MNTYEKILYVANRSRQRGPAFDRAMALAVSSGARLHACLVDHSRAIEAAERVAAHGGWQARKEFLLEHESWLAGEVAILRGNGVEATMDVTWSNNAADAIIGHALRFEADVVVKDASLESHPLRPLHATLDQQLLEECAAPLLLVRTAAGGLPHRVVAAIDVSRESDQALNEAIGEQATRLARQSGAALHFVHCFDTARNFASAQVPDEAALERFAEQHHVPARNRHFLLGNPQDRLAAFADGGASDVLVIGSGRHLGLGRLRAGSTAKSLLDRATCDLLAVKPQGFREAAAEGRDQ